MVDGFDLDFDLDVHLVVVLVDLDLDLDFGVETVGRQQRLGVFPVGDLDFEFVAVDLDLCLDLDVDLGVFGHRVRCQTRRSNVCPFVYHWPSGSVGAPARSAFRRARCPTSWS